MKINAVIIDDEVRGAEALNQLIAQYCDEVRITGMAHNIAEAVALINKVDPDVVFLDIEMPGGSGFELLQSIKEINFDIIFVTAYQEYALKAIKFSALDYLLKPVNISDLQSAIEKIKKRIEKGIAINSRYSAVKSMMNSPNPFNKIILSTTEGYFPVKLEEIIYCKAADSYTHFYLANGKHHIISKRLGEYEDVLSAHNFFRIHKSFLININHIKQVKKADGITVIMSNQEELPVSFRKKEDFMLKMKALNE